MKFRCPYCGKTGELEKYEDSATAEETNTLRANYNRNRLISFSRLASGQLDLIIVGYIIYILSQTICGCDNVLLFFMIILNTRIERSNASRSANGCANIKPFNPNILLSVNRMGM